YWWGPDGTAILASRVDNRPVQLWTIADPANPGAPPHRVRYPAAGTANAEVSLSILSLDGGRVDVSWDQEGFEYLTRAGWTTGRPPTIQVQSRDQRVVQVLTVDPESGDTELIREDKDDVWVDLVNGVPAWLADGRLVTTADDGETRRMRFDDEFVTPPGLQVRAVAHTGETAVITASEEPAEQQVLRIHADSRIESLAGEPGVHSAVATDDLAVISSVSSEHDGVRTRVLRGTDELASIQSVAEVPSVQVRPTIRAVGARSIRTVVLTPDDAANDTKLPVLLDPYGGPHFQRVVAARTPFVLSQWFANQGFAVVVADGRGTPGRGPTWDRAIYQRVAETALDDQVDALHAAAEQDPRLDLSRVAIRGWSFGGELAAMAVLRRPDVFRAAVAGAPVTEQRLYDTHYTERYLGHPEEYPEVYRQNSLLDDAPKLERPLLLIHGLADDNVVMAHTLRLSSALLAAGKPHTVLPLSGVTHMTPQEVVAENLIRLELAFLRQALGMDDEA
ncbi:MAG TPA: prolyl oligopeptidase family serine peptidase, partial [Actinomycetota bacterium]|nr:prolyl oligopeptidase family serine peptidase [Actinomycetota bacterium]